MKGYKKIAVDEIFKPDDNGVSEWILKETLSGTCLDWGSNGAARHNVFFGDDRYTWEKSPARGKILKLRTTGFSDTYNKNRPIRKDIDKHYKSCSCVVCGSKSDLVTDHKNDLYNDPRVLSVTTQNFDDFQCLCNHCNLQKRQVSKQTRKTGKRYGATNIPSLAVFKVDFIKGDGNYDKNDINAMVGTYWYDPVAFMKHLLEK